MVKYTMTSRERLLTVLRGKLPDCVPVAPDTSNMIPAKLTGLPFWDLYLYRKIPIWEAYIECARFFNFDALMDGYFPLTFPYEEKEQGNWNTYIVLMREDRIVTQRAYRKWGRLRWESTVTVYYRQDPPTYNFKPEKIGLPETPQKWLPLEGVEDADTGPTGLKRVKELMGDQGLVGVNVTGCNAFSNEEDIFRYYDHPELHEQWALKRYEKAERRFTAIMEMDEKPDFLCVGGSGTFITGTEEMFRRIAFPAVKRVTELASAAGIPTHLHSCGPERRLVEIMAEETTLTVIDPLEVPPMGDCDLGDLKRRFGHKIVLKGNLHTTDIMLRGTPDSVSEASLRAIDAAAAGGRFILSTGDQCGRDTPFENIRAMIDTARTYGKY
ncbi:MAG: uroporphyrinogen decarboxylase family protein [Spirochaetia bacterium]